MQKTMMSSLYFRSAFKFSLATIVLLLSFQSHATAQVNNSQQLFPQVQPDSLRLQPPLPNFSERKIRLLRRLKLPVEPVIPNTSEQEISLLLKLGDRKVYVYRGGSLQASYPVAIGQPRPDKQTPTGKFKVINMIKDPAWENPFVSHKEVIPPGLNNPLGERWIGFWTDGKDEIGFHGTYRRDSVGKAVSNGCVRMYNEDVRKLYELVKIGTPVTVIP
ncbi:L,D-transpeptidase [Nostoc sp. UHCC 0302]|uniref:L,D-transpeptidase n=1 Tax=Nostoc sp. UHCC 0302 TaxID=3134896 RepID=UPI00311CC76C